MKTDIHPQYSEATVTCSCGNVFKTGSTKTEITVELCSACHPFFTGKQKIIDTAGKVEKFKKKMEQKQTDLVSKKEKRAKIKAEKGTTIKTEDEIEAQKAEKKSKKIAKKKK